MGYERSKRREDKYDYYSLLVVTLRYYPLLFDTIRYYSLAPAPPPPQADLHRGRRLLAPPAGCRRWWRPATPSAHGYSRNVGVGVGVGVGAGVGVGVGIGVGVGVGVGVKEY